MKTPNAGWGTWLLAGLGGAIVIAFVLMLFRSPSHAPSTAQQPSSGAGSTVGLERWGDGAADTLLEEEAMLRDPTPLFLPTRWNVGENALPPDARREPGSSFQGYPPKLTFAETELKLSLPAPVTVPLRPADAFATDQPGRPFIGFGQTDPGITPLPARGGFVEVVATGDGRLMMAQPLRDARPPSEGSWQPLEFLVAIDRSGVVRPPVLTESSRVPEVDGYFQEYLTDQLHIGEQLAPGFYRVCIGP